MPTTTLPLPNGWTVTLEPVTGTLVGGAVEVTAFNSHGEVVPVCGGSGIPAAHHIVITGASLGLILTEATREASLAGPA